MVSKLAVSTRTISLAIALAATGCGDARYDEARDGDDGGGPDSSQSVGPSTAEPVSDAGASLPSDAAMAQRMDAALESDATVVEDAREEAPPVPAERDGGSPATDATPDAGTEATDSSAPPADAGQPPVTADASTPEPMSVCPAGFSCSMGSGLAAEYVALATKGAPFCADSKTMQPLMCKTEADCVAAGFNPNSECIVFPFVGAHCVQACP